MDDCPNLPMIPCRVEALPQLMAADVAVEMRSVATSFAFGPDLAENKPTAGSKYLPLTKTAK